MTKRADEALPRPLDGGVARNIMSTFTLAAIGLAVFIVGAVVFSVMYRDPPSTITKSTSAVEQIAPPATTGLGGAIIMPGTEQNDKGN